MRVAGVARQKEKQYLVNVENTREVPEFYLIVNKGVLSATGANWFHYIRGKIEISAAGKLELNRCTANG